jgi:hypothetical protein
VVDHEKYLLEEEKAVAAPSNNQDKVKALIQRMKKKIIRGEDLTAQAENKKL